MNICTKNTDSVTSHKHTAKLCEEEKMYEALNNEPIEWGRALEGTHSFGCCMCINIAFSSCKPGNIMGNQNVLKKLKILLDGIKTFLVGSSKEQSI